MQPSRFRAPGNARGVHAFTCAAPTAGDTHHAPNRYDHTFTQSHGDCHNYPVAHLDPNVNSHTRSGLVRQWRTG